MGKVSKAVARVVGNWGISFFSPLASTNVVLDLEFVESVLIALISSSIVAGLTISYEVSKYGGTTDHA